MADGFAVVALGQRCAGRHRHPEYRTSNHNVRRIGLNQLADVALLSAI